MVYAIRVLSQNAVGEYSNRSITNFNSQRVGDLLYMKKLDTL